MKGDCWRALWEVCQSVYYTLIIDWVWKSKSVLLTIYMLCVSKWDYTSYFTQSRWTSIWHHASLPARPALPMNYCIGQHKIEQGSIPGLSYTRTVAETCVWCELSVPWSYMIRCSIRAEAISCLVYSGFYERLYPSMLYTGNKTIPQNIIKDTYDDLSWMIFRLGIIQAALVAWFTFRFPSTNNHSGNYTV